MTVQIEDTLLLEGDTWTLVACSGELVHPRQFRMAPVALHGACTRGWYCAFEIDDTHLVLRALTLRCADGGYLPIHGTAPRIDRRARSASYADLALRVPYTGRVRIGQGAVQPRGVRAPAAWRSVLDVELADGRLERIIDRGDLAHARQDAGTARSAAPRRVATA